MAPHHFLVHILVFHTPYIISDFSYSSALSILCDQIKACLADFSYREFGQELLSVRQWINHIKKLIFTLLVSVVNQQTNCSGGNRGRPS